MPVDYRPRGTPCTHCGDTVLIGVQAPLKLWGFRIGKGGDGRLEHAGPGPNDEIFDGVDDACTRPPVTR